MMNPVMVDETLDEIEHTLRFLSTDFEFESTPRTSTPVDDLRHSLTTAVAPNVPARPLRSYRYSINPSPCVSPKTNSFAPWPLCDAQDIIYFNNAVESSQRRYSGRFGVPFRDSRNSIPPSQRRQSSISSVASFTSFPPSPYPAPQKPLPPLPSPTRSSKRLSSAHRLSSDVGSFTDWDRFSQYSTATTTEASRSSFQSISIIPSSPTVDSTDRIDCPCPSLGYTASETASRKSAIIGSPVVDLPFEELVTSTTSEPGSGAQDKQPVRGLELTHNKRLQVEKRKGNAVFHIDASTGGSTVATKHGKNIIRFWNVESGNLTGAVKFSAYTEAQCRSREYLIRSHTILSETSKLAAVSSRFGRSVDIWDWAKSKRLQQISDVDRWAASQFESLTSGWSPLAAYRGDASRIDLYAATSRDKKPYVKVSSIDLKKSKLPSVMQYPELALSPTSPLLVAAAGPRNHKLGRPSPDKETMLAVWEIHDYRDVFNEPYRVLQPSQYRELTNALPVSLFTYGSLVVSIWIPAGQRADIRHSVIGGLDHRLVPIPVPFRHVLVWDMSDGSTRTYPIPNTTSCISPDCRYVAHCQVAERRTKLAILNASTGEELWCVGGEGNLKSMEAFGDLSRVNDMAFSPDGKLLFLGDRDGNTCIYDVSELIR